MMLAAHGRMAMECVSLGAVRDGSLPDYFCRALPCLLFKKKQKGYVLFFGAKKRTKRNIHPPQGPSLYGGDAIRKVAARRRLFSVLVSRDTRYRFLCGSCGVSFYLCFLRIFSISSASTAMSFRWRRMAWAVWRLISSSVSPPRYFCSVAIERV